MILGHHSCIKRSRQQAFLQKVLRVCPSRVTSAIANVCQGNLYASKNHHGGRGSAAHWHVWGHQLNLLIELFLAFFFFFFNSTLVYLTRVPQDLSAPCRAHISLYTCFPSPLWCAPFHCEFVLHLCQASPPPQLRGFCASSSLQHLIWLPLKCPFQRRHWLWRANDSVFTGVSRISWTTEQGLLKCSERNKLMFVCTRWSHGSSQSEENLQSQVTLNTKWL